MNDTVAKDAVAKDADARGGAAAVTEAEAEELLRAGAVLPPGTTGGGDRAVPMFTQAYRHPGLDDRIVVRLVAAEQGEGLGTGFLGLEPEGEPTEVGLGQPRALGFPEWVLVHHPSDGHLAMSLVEEMNKVARTAKSRPKKARATYESIGERLAGSVPHFLPTFYEQAGRVFLAADETAYASQMFVNARKAETAHALPFDEERMDAVFLEFALAEAVPTKMLSSYAKGLSSRVPAATAFRHLRGLFVRLAANGLPPSSPGAGDLRRLAKAVAGGNALAEEIAYLREMLTLPGTVKAPPGWWKTHRPALLELTRQEPAFRGTLLELMPSDVGAGRTAPVAGPVGEVRCHRRALRRHPARRGASRRRYGRMDPQIPGAVAGRLSPRSGRSCIHSSTAWPTHCAPNWRPPDGVLTPPVGDVNLLDQLLSLGIPVADPRSVSASTWWRGRPVNTGAISSPWKPTTASTGRSGSAAPRTTGRATRDRRHPWPGPPVDGRCSPNGWARSAGSTSRRSCPRSTATAAVLQTLGWLPGEVLAVAEQAVREALSTGIAPALARALRSGLLDELGWPAWEEALEAHESGNLQREVLVTDAWPHLIVLAGMHLRVIGSEGTVLAHELSVPDRRRATAGMSDYHYVDGELFVWWRPVARTAWQGYWHHDPSERVTVEGSAPPASASCGRARRDEREHGPRLAPASRWRPDHR
jgi:hypothetical protein